MAFIRTMKIRTNADGMIESGSAYLVESVYEKSVVGHSRQRIKEKLGKVLFMDEDGKGGVFLSRDRGLFHYDVRTDTYAEVTKNDARIAGSPRLRKQEIHTTFGNVYLLFSYLKAKRFLQVLQACFPENENYERTLAHLLYSVLRDGSGITCDLFTEHSAFSYLMDEAAVSSLKCDSRFFSHLGSDTAKVAFFRALAAWMRERNPEFGQACYIDATRLPDDIENNPYNALRCETSKGCAEEMRLGLVVDKKTGIPVWFVLFPGNQMDIQTVQNIVEDVHSSLGISISSLVLDSGYASKRLVQTFMGNGTTDVIVMMPRRKGYPYHELYQECKDELYQPKYFFVRSNSNRHSSLYFGKKQAKQLFETDIYTYVYVDWLKAQEGLKAFMTKHASAYAKLSDAEKNWYLVKSGFFILMTNLNLSPVEVLDRYRRRIHIEEVIKDAKDFEKLLPLKKWNALRVRGKILFDVMSTIVRSLLLEASANSGRSVGDIFHSTEALDCFLRQDSQIIVGPPTPQVRNAYAIFNEKIPSSISLREWRLDVFNNIKPS